MYSKVKSGISTEDLNNIVAQKEKKDNELADELISIIKSKMKYYKDLVISTIRDHQFQTDLIKQLKDAAYKGERSCSVLILKFDLNDNRLKFIKKETKGYISNVVEYEKYETSVIKIALKKLYYKDFDNFEITNNKTIKYDDLNDDSDYFIAKSDDDKKKIGLGPVNTKINCGNIFDLGIANFLVHFELDITEMADILKKDNIDVKFSIGNYPYVSNLSFMFNW